MVMTATITGRSHHARRRNGQDAAFAAQAAQGCAFGVVLDGCGGPTEDETGRRHSSRNGVAARLLGTFVEQWLAAHVQPESELPALVGNLEAATVGFMRDLVKLIPFTHPSGRNLFVGTHLLATCLGFLVTPGQACFFSAGDGILASNWETTVLDEANRPNYLGYRVADGGPPTAFRTHAVAREQLRWLAVATDGWDPDLLPKAVAAPSGVILQRKMNVWIRERPCFDDDGAIAVWREGV